jgi:hypothetical protein
MGMVERDYVLRMIQQLVRALARIAGLKRAGQLDEALEDVSATLDDVLGPLRQTLEVIDPQSAARLLSDRDRIEAYAVLVAEEGSILELMGDTERSGHRTRRALALLLEAQRLGHTLSPDALEVLEALQRKVEEPAAAEPD